MKSQFYSIFDTASGLYLRPFLAQSDGQAKRSFSDIAVDADHEVGRHPEDYSMIRLGIFDDNNGKIVDEQNETLITGLEAVAASRNPKKSNLELFDNNAKISNAKE